MASLMSEKMRTVNQRLEWAVLASDLEAVNVCVADLREIAAWAHRAGRAGHAAILRAQADDAEEARTLMSGGV